MDSAGVEHSRFCRYVPGSLQEALYPAVNGDGDLERARDVPAAKNKTKQKKTKKS